MQYICSLMRSKKLLSAFFTLVLLLQLLPVKQVISYFFVDNQMNEELVEVKKPLQPNEEKLIHNFDPSIALSRELNKKAFLLFSVTLPSLYTAEIPTPPPNCA